MEKLNKILVTIGGIAYLLFGIFNATFFKFFRNSPDFAQIKPFLAKIIQMLNVGVVTFFVMLGIVMLMFRNEILNSKLGKALLIGSSAFFFIRGAAEFFFPKCVIPLVFTMILCGAIYLIPALGKNK
jgi:hypothetical protein